MAANTPGTERVRSLADLALTKPEGLIIQYTVARYGSLRNAHFASRAFQTAFSSIRSKMRRAAMTVNQKKYETFDTNVKGKYDGLSCYKRELGDGKGFTITLAPATSLDFALDILDGETGEQLAEFSPEQMRIEMLWSAWFRAYTQAMERIKGKPEGTTPTMINPWSDDDEAWMLERFPDKVPEAYANLGVKLRTVVEPIATSSDNYTADYQGVSADDYGDFGSDE